MAASLNVEDQNKKQTENESTLNVSLLQKQQQCQRDKSNQQYLEKEQSLKELVVSQLT